MKILTRFPVLVEFLREAFAAVVYEIRFSLERTVIVVFLFDAFLLVVDVGGFEADVPVRVFFNTNIVAGGKSNGACRNE